jgi:hypothetical protein
MQMGLFYSAQRHILGNACVVDFQDFTDLVVEQRDHHILDAEVMSSNPVGFTEK